MSELIRPQRWETQAGCEAVVAALGLNPVGLLSQDWLCYGNDAERLADFCDFYDRDDLDDETRFAIMPLILDGLEQTMPVAANDGMCDRVERYLRDRFIFHFHTIRYWTLPNDPEETNPEYIFAVTPMVRRVWADCYRPEYAKWLD